MTMPTVDFYYLQGLFNKKIVNDIPPEIVKIHR